MLFCGDNFKKRNSTSKRQRIKTLGVINEFLHFKIVNDYLHYATTSFICI